MKGSPTRTGMTGQAWFCPVLPSLSPTVMGLAVLLPGDSVARLVEHFLDLRQGDDLGIEIDVNGLRRDIDLDPVHTLQFANRSLDCMLAVLARDVRCYKRRRF